MHKVRSETTKNTYIKPKPQMHLQAIDIFHILMTLHFPSVPSERNHALASTSSSRTQIARIPRSLSIPPQLLIHIQIIRKKNYKT